MFTITRHCGFQIAFPNGYTISVQFGPGNYCHNRDDSFFWPAKSERYESPDAEVAVIGPDGLVYLSEYDQVLPRQTPAEVGALIAAVMAGTFTIYPKPVYGEND